RHAAEGHPAGPVEGSTAPTGQVPASDHADHRRSVPPGRVVFFGRWVAVPEFWSLYLPHPWNLIAAGAVAALALFGFIGVSAFLMLAVLSSEVFGVVLAGYASGSKWSLFGGVREAAQVVSYEVPRAMCVVIPICIAGTLNLNAIGREQTGWFWEWNVFHDPF